MGTPARFRVKPLYFHLVSSGISQSCRTLKAISPPPNNKASIKTILNVEALRCIWQKMNLQAARETILHYRIAKDYISGIPKFPRKTGFKVLARPICRISVNGPDNSSTLYSFEWQTNNTVPTQNVTPGGRNQPTFARKKTDGLGSIPGRIRSVRDMWGKDSRHFVESNPFNNIRKDRFIPGLLRLMSKWVVTGFELDACESVLEFLKVIYDLVETHQQVSERGVLHRNITWDTVLCRPQHFSENAPTSFLIRTSGEGDKESLCLLRGFENSCFTKDQKFRGGIKTNMFMACDLLYGERGYEMLRRYHVPPVTLNQLGLEGEALELYTRFYGQTSWLQSVLSGAVKEVHPFTSGDFTISSQPHHDMESVYWIILRTISARGTDKDDAYSIVTFPVQKEIWALRLHPIYQPLTGMVADMGQYIAMRWSRFPDAPFWHSHEAFKRLLLREIVRMNKRNDPIPLWGLF
ncbi:hypothetical protein Clacol_003212 [Clathrus columnatus]|uniref:Fungal-type protein kinase domain-containing protein n=1 Tax=Clathrus columnatus TaxID=1419009 RepID=A0AAV5A8V7_9AGAM|nr:hypothetical protein Clacol_003212 [Clathrus columnatus]